MLDDIAVVDPHFHLIDCVTNPYPWLEPDADRPDIFGGRDAELRHVFLEEDYRRGAAEVPIAKGVHVQAIWDPADPVGETAWLAGRRAQHGLPTAAVAFADLSAPDVGDVLAAQADHDFVHGIRHILNWDDDPSLRFCDRPDYLTSTDWLTGYAMLERYGLSFDAQLFHSQMDDLLGVATAYPATPIVVDHAGMPVRRDPDSIAAWSAALGRLAEAPNVSVKISGLGLANPDWTTGSIRPLVLTVIERFGIDRAMFASDFPVDRLFSTFSEVYRAFDTITADFTHEERTKLFRTNAERVYRI